MRSFVKKILRIFLIVLISILYLFGIYLLFLSITDYKPQKIESPDQIGNIGNIENNQIIYDEFTILSWNIGHAGLSKEMDFYYYGGKNTKPSIEIYQKNLNGILNMLVTYSYVDFILLQDVDVFSDRSYYSNQEKLVSDFLPDFAFTFALNYDVKYDLLPLYAPMGRVKAGLQTLMKYKSVEIKKFAYSSCFNYPKKLLMPDQCFLVTKYLLKNKKQLILINTHNSIVDDHIINNHELEELKLYAVSEYIKGNYVIIGGGWNMNPPNFSKVKVFTKEYPLFHFRNEIVANYMPYNWKWVYDSETPSCRRTNKAYDISTTATTISDFYLISPNIEILNIRNFDLNFEFSNHNPVLMNVKLK
ncbi:MAG: hypothetical protein HXX18_10030 [Bacteroidetes bacterium]|nr:hypothetical protein [Bacteroidota bacterium]